MVEGRGFGSSRRREQPAALSAAEEERAKAAPRVSEPLRQVPVHDFDANRLLDGALHGPLKDVVQR